MKTWVSYLFVALTVILTVYGQIAIKWAVNNAGALPASNTERISYIVGLLLNGWVISGLFSAFLASIAWMLAMSKLPLSHAYPFVGSSFILVIFLSYLVFSEPISMLKIVGVMLIFIGITISSLG